MAEIKIINQIDATTDGPIVYDEQEQPQRIHLRQGSLDGACGPYCLFMTLIICGVVQREEATSLDMFDGRTALGKLYKLLEQYGGFFRQGTNLKDFQRFVQQSFNKNLDSDVCSTLGIEIRKFIEFHVRNNHPVILGIEWSTGGHWVVVIGLDYERVSEDEKMSLYRFLVLDPGNEPSPVCAWNGVIDAHGTGGHYPFRWWNSDEKVKLSCALAIWLK